MYLQGEQLENDEVGSLAFGGVGVSTPDAISEIFATTLPTAVCDTSKLNMFLWCRSFHCLTTPCCGGWGRGCIYF